ncbi:DUF192 domain-containing protein [Candidatus Woesearchaeota archaeon]|nr:DUF192 domain-containing protein [Candidatus Woesearchaeota archaeon]
MIKNQTKGTLLAAEYRLCSSFFSRCKGLMFSIKPRSLVMAFHKEQKVGIHMMFVFFPIDVLWVDKEQKVVAIQEHLKPFSAATSKELAQYVIELPIGMIAASNTEIGDNITWVKL